MTAASIPDEQDSWTDYEVLALLDAVAYFGAVDDWDAVAEYVGGARSAVECLTKFLSLGVVDRYQERGDDRIRDIESILRSSNPVMLLVHSVTSLVNPGLGAEVAKSCLRTLATSASPDLFQQQPLTPGGGNSRAFTHRIFQQALDDAAALAESMELLESSRVQTLTCELVDLMLQRIEVKSRALQQLDAHIQQDLAVVAATIK